MNNKVEMDIFLGEQDRWIWACKFMEAFDNFNDRRSIVKTEFIVTTLTGMEKFRLP